MFRLSQGWTFMKSIHMYVCTNLVKIEHIQHEFKCMSVQTEPILNTIWYQFKCMSLQIHQFFLTKLVIRIMKAEVSEKIWICILWCKNKCWEQYSLGHFLNSFTVSYSMSRKGTAATLVVRQLVTALNNCNFKAEKYQVSLRLYLSF